MYDTGKIPISSSVIRRLSNCLVKKSKNMKKAILVNNASLKVELCFENGKIIYDVAGGPKDYTYDVERVPTVVLEFLKGKRGRNACARHAFARKKRNFIASQFEHIATKEQFAALEARREALAFAKEQDETRTKERVKKFFLQPTLAHWDNMVPNVHVEILPLEAPTGGWESPLFLNECRLAVKRLTLCKEALDSLLDTYRRFAPVNIMQGYNNVGYVKTWLHFSQIRVLIPECLFKYEETMSRLEARIQYLENLA